MPPPLTRTRTIPPLPLSAPLLAVKYVSHRSPVRAVPAHCGWGVVACIRRHHARQQFWRCSSVGVLLSSAAATAVASATPISVFPTGGMVRPLYECDHLLEVISCRSSGRGRDLFGNVVAGVCCWGISGLVCFSVSLLYLCVWACVRLWRCLSVVCVSSLHMFSHLDISAYVFYDRPTIPCSTPTLSPSLPVTSLHPAMQVCGDPLTLVVALVRVSQMCSRKSSLAHAQPRAAHSYATPRPSACHPRRLGVVTIHGTYRAQLV